MKRLTIQLVSCAIIFLVGASPDAKVAEYDESVLRIQQRLRNLGYDSGKIDGIWGERTAIAFETALRDLEGFKKESKLALIGDGGEKAQAESIELTSSPNQPVQRSIDITTELADFPASPRKNYERTVLRGAIMAILFLGGVVGLLAITAILMLKGAVRISENEVGLSSGSLVVYVQPTA